jgi:hypothetical protein
MGQDPFKQAANRRLQDRAEISEMLVKRPGPHPASLEDVAAVAGIRPIRLKELGYPGFDNPTLGALMKVLAELRNRGP